MKIWNSIERDVQTVAFFGFPANDVFGNNMYKFNKIQKSFIPKFLLRDIRERSTVM